MIITNATLVTLWERQPLIEGALVAIEGKTIVDFGKMGKLIDRYEDTEVLDVKGRVLMPGLVDAHAHLWRSLAPGPSGMGPRTFRELQEKFWWRFAKALDETDVYLSALVGLLDSIRAGFTSVFDHHWSPGFVKGSLDAVWQAFTDVGARGCLCYGVSDWDGEEAARAGIEENQRFVARCRTKSSDMMAGLFGLDASYSVAEKTLSESVGAARELESGFHVHVAEDVSDLNDTRAKYQKTPVERLAAAGALRRGSLAAHCIHVDGSDDERLRNTGSVVVQCPQSNVFSAVDMARDPHRLGAMGVPVALGTDGLPLSLFDGFRAAVLQHRMRARSPSESVEAAFRTAFSGNADAATLLFGPPLGRIKPGARADLLVLDYTPSTPLTTASLVDHLFAGLARSPIQAVIVDGKIVYRDGVFRNLDEAAARAGARQAAKNIWERM